VLRRRRGPLRRRLRLGGGFVEQQELGRQGRRGSGAVGRVVRSVVRSVKVSEEPLPVLARDGRRGVVGAELDTRVGEGGAAVAGLGELDGEQVVQVQHPLDRRTPVRREPCSSRSCRRAARRCR
jgi:hypothetical protein